MTGGRPGRGFEDVGAMAVEAMTRAYAPYSGFIVGAALRGTSGRVWTGANIEVATSGVSLCAERVALATAVFDGERSFDLLVLAVEAGVPVSPCGLCRQTLQEFGADMEIVMLSRDGSVERSTLAELFPMPFERR